MRLAEDMDANCQPKSMRDVIGKVSLQRKQGRPMKSQGPSHTSRI